jgi:hypothetical protein
MIVGVRGQIVTTTQNSGSHVRTEPNGKADSLATIDNGVSFDVIGGPLCVESPKYGHLVWWQIRLDDKTEGWITEGGIEAGVTEYWIEPIPQSIAGYWIGEKENLYIIAEKHEGFDGYVNVYDHQNRDNVILGSFAISGDTVTMTMNSGKTSWTAVYTYRVVGKSLLLTQKEMTTAYRLQD